MNLSSPNAGAAQDERVFSLYTLHPTPNTLRPVYLPVLCGKNSHNHFSGHWGIHLLDFAIQTAREAGRVLADRFGRNLKISNKSEIDLVTESDLASEKVIIDR